MIIAIDFDGTIVQDAYPAIGEIMPGAREAINQLKADGHYIIIWTCRTGHYAHQVFDWLYENDIMFDRINESCPQNLADHNGIDTRKVFAHVYIDDRALLSLPPWPEIYKIVTQKATHEIKKKYA